MTTEQNSAHRGTTLTPHPLELIRIDVVQLVFLTNRQPSPDIFIDGRQVQLSVRNDPIDVGQENLQVFVRAAYGIAGIDCDDDKEPDTPCSLLIELAGTFKKNKDLPKETLELFQQNGALTSLAPYLREHVYSLSMRSGIKPIIIPLFQVPVIRVTQDGDVCSKE